jgi:hypothetical protein
MMRFDVLDTYRGWHYYIDVRRGKVSKIWAGCREWRTFEDARRHYRRDTTTCEKWLKMDDGVSNKPDGGVPNYAFNYWDHAYPVPTHRS